MAPVRPHHLPGIALIFALVAVLPAVLGDRSPYVPDPVTYPGLLPQFTSTTVAPTGPGGGAQHQHQQRPGPSTQRPRPKPTTTTQRVTTVEEVPAEEDNGLGDRIGEESPQPPEGQQRPQRPDSQQRPQRPCDGQGGYGGVPCYDCVVYISRTGTITRFYPRESRDD